MESKVCSKCKLLKPASDYWTRLRRGKRGLRTACKQCDKEVHNQYVDLNRDKINEQNYRCQQSPQGRETYYQRNFGISLDFYNQQLSKQENRCAGCDTHISQLKQRLAVDHNHITGQIRGLLCGNCNRSLGLIKESRETLQRLADYLDRWE
jgi:hypothetical protein